MKRSCMAGMALLLGLVACSSSPVATSGDDVVLSFLWSIDEGSGDDPVILRLQGGGIHRVPSQVRLLNPEGVAIVEANTVPTEVAGVLCAEARLGIYRADVVVPPGDRAAFSGMNWPAGYQVVGLVGSDWLLAELAPSGCR